jgi:hypothetical protein
MNKLIFLSFIFLGLIACSPTLTPFSQKLYDDQKWSLEELQKIQFYLSDDIVLYRKVASGETTINNGKIKMVNGEKIEEVIFKKGIPGVLIFMPKADRFAISFDSDTDPKYLIFGPNPKMTSRYVLLGKEWDRNSGQVTYDNQVYETYSGSAFAGLLVNLKRANKLERKSSEVKGRVIQ